ncbi:hypothetical protein UPYG_G00335790 [Umbra pygmaea]|uniref:Ribosomal protein n=1 Tax=Umbra pygmaea TaxID=75934 RepID=A0ABD0VXC2_UMBPY
MITYVNASGRKQQGFQAGVGDTMGPLLLNQLMSSFTRHLTQMTRITLGQSYPTSTISRFLSSFASYPARVLLAPGRHIQPLVGTPSSSIGQTSLLGKCQHLVCLQPSAGMKTRTSLRRRCKDCFFVVRRGRLFVFCKTHPRHKQRQG